MMLKQVCRGAVVAALVSLAAVTTASAQTVNWFGGGVLTDVTNCPVGNFTAATSKAFKARYRHPNVGSNSANALLSFFFDHAAFSFIRLDGTFGDTFETVIGFYVAAGGGKYKPRVRILKQEPAAIDGTTESIYFKGIVKRFSGFPGNENCEIKFETVLFKQ